MAAETRQRIVEASEKCFGRYGYDKTTNRDIADEAGLTTGALYHYFESKQHLFVEVFTERSDLVHQSLREASLAPDTAIAKLCAILDRAVQWNVEDEHIARFVATAEVELGRHPEFTDVLGDSAARAARTASLIEEIVRYGLRTGELPPGTDVEGVVGMLMSATLGLLHFAAVFGDVEAHARAANSFKLLLEGRLFQPASASARFRRRRAG